MAERRMFSKVIIDSDAFLDMPLSTQALYFHLSMRADDDGFLNNARKIQRLVGASDDDLRLLLMKRFVIGFEGGILVIKHWRMNNYLRKDRYTPTVYQDEYAMLGVKKNGSYTLEKTDGIQAGIPDGSQCVTQVSIGKDSIDKKRIEKTVCPEPETAPDRKKAVSLILNDKTEYWIFEDQIAEWKELFPAVDVMQELRKMRSWLDSNQSRRKTKRGILRFVNGWLSKEQDKGWSRQGGGSTYDTGREARGDRTAEKGYIQQLIEAGYDPEDTTGF
ncbi:hypothetical protein K040078D81_31580 [Blautia hominis]|uniref:Replisome organizer n=1 Tax=Blautia hominis TaxID=2025493 RepID=A0ABQ0BC60_9FIRM